MKKFLGVVIIIGLLVGATVFNVPLAHATVAVTTVRNDYAGAGTTGPFTYAFKIWTDSDLLVIKTDANGTETVLTLNVDYTVTGAGVATGGTITTTDAVPTGSTITLMRAHPYLQSQNWPSGQAIPALPLNNVADKLSHQIQQLAEASNRSFQLPRSSTGGPIRLGPAPSHIIGWDAAGLSLRNYATTAVQSASIDTIGNYGDDLATAVTTIGSGVQSLWIDKAIALTADVSVPANITLHFMRSGRITGAYTLTLASQPVAGPWQIIADETSLAFTVGCTFMMDWTGPTSAGIGKAFNAFAGVDGVKFVFSPGVTYTITSTVTFIDVGENVTVYAYGAKFAGDYDDIWIHIHDRMNALHPVSATQQYHHLGQFNWLGGEFLNSSATKTASEALRIEGNRAGSVQDTRIWYFWKGYKEIKSENVLIYHNFFYGCVYAITSEPDAGASPTYLNDPQNLVIEQNLISNPEVSGDAEAGIALLTRCHGLVIRKNTFSVDPEFGTHAIVYILDKNPANAGTTPGHGHVIEENHFEQFAGTAIWYDNGAANIGFKQVSIRENTFSSIEDGVFTYCKLEKVVGGQFEKNYLYAYGNTVTGIDLDADCKRISISEVGWSGWTGITTTVSYACSREQITFLPQQLVCNQLPTGWGSSSHSTGNETIQVWTLLPAAYRYDGIPPAGYWVNLRAADSGSAATACSVVLKKNAAASPYQGIYLNLQGTTNGQYRQVSRYIPCESDGSLYIEMVATGTNTLTINLEVSAIQR